MQTIAARLSVESVADAAYPELELRVNQPKSHKRCTGSHTALDRARSGVIFRGQAEPSCTLDNTTTKLVVT
ncbi:MAG: hypothetical protein JO232_23850 [Verrucomicrobia bacterium]|nr:hypothetical protein [Verrucomicrobiota bacterium]